VPIWWRKPVVLGPFNVKVEPWPEERENEMAKKITAMWKRSMEISHKRIVFPKYDPELVKEALKVFPPSKDEPDSIGSMLKMHDWIVRYPDFENIRYREALEEPVPEEQRVERLKKMLAEIRLMKTDEKPGVLRDLICHWEIRTLIDLGERKEALEKAREYSTPDIMTLLERRIGLVLDKNWPEVGPIRSIPADDYTAPELEEKEFESPGHPWVMTSDGEKVILFSTGLIRPSPKEREIPRSEFYHGSDPKKDLEFTLRKIKETKGLKGKELKELRKFRGKRQAIVVKSEINASVEEWDKIPDKLEWSGIIPTLCDSVPHIPRISIAFSSDAIIYAGDVHGGGTRFMELAEVKKNGTYTRLSLSHYVKMDLPEEYSNVTTDIYDDLVEPNLFLFGGELWICLTVRAKRAPGRRAVCVAKTKDAEGDATITSWKTLKGYFVCPGAQPRIAITKEGVFCVAKMLEKGSNKEEKIGTLSVYFSKDGKKWEHLKGKIPEIRCGDYDVTVSPDGAIYLFICAVRDKPDGEEDSERQFEKTPKLYKTKNVEEGWEEISLSQFEKVDVKSNLQACFHKGKLVIAAETTDSKIAFAVIGNEIIKEAKDGVDNGGKDAKKDAIDFAEVDRLITTLDSDDYEQRKRAKQQLITLGGTSVQQSETLGSYLIERSKKETSPEVRAGLCDVIKELSIIPIVRPFHPDHLNPEEYGRPPGVRFWVRAPKRAFFLLDNRSDLVDAIPRIDRYLLGPVDFEKDFVLICCAGSKPSTNYFATVVKIQRDFEKAGTEVRYKERKPMGWAGCAITYPTDVVLIPRSQLSSEIKVLDADTGKQLAVFSPYSGKDAAGKSDKELAEALKGQNTFLARAAAVELAKSRNKEFALKTLKEFTLDDKQNIWVRKSALLAIASAEDAKVLSTLTSICEKIRTNEMGPWHKTILYQKAINLISEIPGLEALTWLIDVFSRSWWDSERALKKRLADVEKIAKNPEFVEVDRAVKNRAMTAYIHFHGGKAFPVLIDFAGKTGTGYGLIKKALPADLVKGASDEKVLELAREWYKENAPYIVGSTSRFYVDTNARAAGVPVEIWRQIDSEKRGDWNKLTDEEKEKAIEVAKKTPEKARGMMTTFSPSGGGAARRRAWRGGRRNCGERISRGK